MYAVSFGWYSEGRYKPLTEDREKDMSRIDRLKLNEKRSQYDGANRSSVAIFKPRNNVVPAGTSLISNIAFQAPITINISPKSVIREPIEVSESKSGAQTHREMEPEVPFSICNPSTWCR